MMQRRRFLQSALMLSTASVCVGYVPRLGQIRFARVSNEDWLRLVPVGCIAEVDPVTEGATFLGSHATLIVDRSGCRLYPASEI